MFIGAINAWMRSVLSQAAQGWRGLPIYVACSGNFTIERILAGLKLGPIHSNDVSIYSCALGWHLAGQPQRYEVIDDEWRWLEPYLEPGVGQIATLLLLTRVLPFERDNAYAKRMMAAYLAKWPTLHASTVGRVKRATEGVSVASYFAGDCRDFIEASDKNAG